MKYQTIKGTTDRLPDAAGRWRNVVETARQVLERAGAGEIHTPVFEDTGVFFKGVGESSDIVRKEMYRFSDRGERDLTLRPEATAPIVRAFIEHGMNSLPFPVKLWTFEPMFRAEKPQKGRERQFHQIGLEIFGAEEPLADAEAIDLASSILRVLGLRRFTVHVGSVGDPQDRERYNAYLRNELAPRLDQLSEDSRARLDLNPMRILDSKDRGDQNVLRELKVKPMLEFLGPDALEHFEAVQGYLRALGCEFQVDETIVRGLDYYRRTAFELKHPDIGAQAALGGGGRYDGLTELLGGQPTPGVGFGLGVERIILALEAEGVVSPERLKPLIAVLPLDESSVGSAAALGRAARQIASAFVAYRSRPLGKALNDAQKLGARFAVLIGEAERAADSVSVKNLETREQFSVPAGEFTTWLSNEVEKEQA